MKYGITALLILTLILAGCASAQPTPTATPDVTAAPAATIPPEEDVFDTDETAAPAGEATAPAGTGATLAPTATPPVAPTQFDGGITLPEDVL